LIDLAQLRRDAIGRILAGLGYGRSCRSKMPDAGNAEEDINLIQVGSRAMHVRGM
jgi:hypothetical protein